MPLSIARSSIIMQILSESHIRDNLTLLILSPLRSQRSPLISALWQSPPFWALIFYNPPQPQLGKSGNQLVMGLADMDPAL
ncbi:uncharacterized protein PV07_05888 [Cladophialophora immunda]|uniref:Uncharacterized protein n=1 Tax=Cladophialophora immunda TaxID=569365 RepID=A0A0D2CJ34_9EURO|nr:uncharacterized protein PV07_05888 [Cladophialophora immunda]KIW30115.1 hypothetical protein PV07_05888 [Cladophialophora immunda]